MIIYTNDLEQRDVCVHAGNYYTVINCMCTIVSDTGKWPSEGTINKARSN